MSFMTSEAATMASIGSICSGGNTATFVTYCPPQSSRTDLNATQRYTPRPSSRAASKCTTTSTTSTHPVHRGVGQGAPIVPDGHAQREQRGRICTQPLLRPLHAHLAQHTPTEIIDNATSRALTDQVLQHLVLQHLATPPRRLAAPTLRPTPGPDGVARSVWGEKTRRGAVKVGR